MKLLQTITGYRRFKNAQTETNVSKDMQKSTTTLRPPLKQNVTKIITKMQSSFSAQQSGKLEFFNICTIT